MDVENFADRVVKILSAVGFRRIVSPNDLVDAWAAFVSECEDGYGWDIYEYRNELALRDAIADLLDSEELARYAEFGGFQARTAQLDERFKAVLAGGPDVLGEGSPWWRRRIPGRAGAEFVQDAKAQFGVELQVE